LTRVDRGPSGADRHHVIDVCRPGALSLVQRDEMFELFARYYQGAMRPRFERDLAEKEWVATMRNAATGGIAGFTTAMRVTVTIDGAPVVGVFSGDTVIHGALWGGSAAAGAIAATVRLFFRVARGATARSYWFLISSSPTTYRLLTLLFRDFYPAYGRPTPAAVRRTIEALALTKYGAEFDIAQGVVRPAHPTPIRPDVTRDPRRANEHTVFFRSANPEYRRGVELACVAELAVANLTPLGRRLLGDDGTS
jgi:hypothetical protein